MFTRKKIVFAMFITILLIGCMNIEDKMLSYAKKKYNKQFDSILFLKGRYDLINGKSPDYLFLTNKNDKFSFRVIFENDEFSDDYLNALVGSNIADKAVEDLSYNFPYISNITYTGYLFSDNIISYVNNDTQRVYTEDELNIIIAFCTQDKITDIDFMNIIETVYKSIYKFSTLSIPGGKNLKFHKKGIESLRQGKKTFLL